MRITVLLLVLCAVLLHAWQDRRRREERSEWKRPLSVALVVVEHEPVDEEVLDLSSACRQTVALRLGGGRSERDRSTHDSRIYVATRRAQGTDKFLEGVGQQGGYVGILQVELAEDMIDFALIVAAHELFHTLGAADHYDERGETRVPEGLAEPDRKPLYPQQYVEITARNRPISANLHVPPDAIAELRVGPITAREIGWVQ